MLTLASLIGTPPEPSDLFQINLQDVLEHRAATQAQAEELIFAYTRKQAIVDGEQFLADGELAQIAKDAGYKCPVYMTRSVHSLIEKAVNHPNWCNDWNGVFHDLMTLSRNLYVNVSPELRKFYCIITGTGRKRQHEFYMQCGPMDIDDPTPVLTLMMKDDL
jgi:hypothetical protein